MGVLRNTFVDFAARLFGLPDSRECCKDNYDSFVSDSLTVENAKVLEGADSNSKFVSNTLGHEAASQAIQLEKRLRSDLSEVENAEVLEDVDSNNLVSKATDTEGSSETTEANQRFSAGSYFPKLSLVRGLMVSVCSALINTASAQYASIEPTASSDVPYHSVIVEEPFIPLNPGSGINPVAIAVGASVGAFALVGTACVLLYLKMKKFNNVVNPTTTLESHQQPNQKELDANVKTNTAQL